MALCIGIMGAENQPLLIKISSSIQEPIKLHYMLHSALDVVEEKTQPSQKTPGSISAAEVRELYLGRLYPSSDDVSIYAYCTSTKTKIILIVEAANTTLRENEIRAVFDVQRFHSPIRALSGHPARLSARMGGSIFRRLHVAYANMIMNPFYQVGQPISSKSFHDFVESLIA